MSPAGLLRQLSLTLIPFVLSLTVHEYAHAWVAHRLGDDTAKEQGRLTLSPQAHIDPVGTLLIPLLSVLFGGIGFIAWARPVPYRPDRFRHGISPRFGSALVGLAGPMSNVVLAALFVGVFSLLKHSSVPLYRPSGDELISLASLTPLGLLLWVMFQTNVALAVFNLLPFPPLDGHHLLPPVLDPVVRPLARYGFGLLMVASLLRPGFLSSILEPPMRWLGEGLGMLVGVVS